MTSNQNNKETDSMSVYGHRVCFRQTKTDKYKRMLLFLN